jgi:nucleoporin POM152
MIGSTKSDLGHAPFELGYRYTAEGKTARHTLKSAQETGILHLAVDPGHHRYDLTQLKDSNYDNNPVSLALEHTVHSRPSVTFIKPHTGPLCLDSKLRGNAKIRLTGSPPFKLNLAIRKPASTKTSNHVINTSSHEWTLDLDEVILSTVGRYEVKILSVSDNSGCLQDILDTDVLSTSVEVVESARIVAVNPHVQDLCVGDTLDFLLQGKAPWTIE